MKRMGIKGEAYPDTDGRCTTFDRGGKVMCLVTVRDGAEDDHPPLEIVGVLVHEATHVWQEVRAAMREGYPSKEFEAYAMQAITQGLIEGYEKTRGRRDG